MLRCNPLLAMGFLSSAHAAPYQLSTHYSLCQCRPHQRRHWRRRPGLELSPYSAWVTSVKLTEMLLAFKSSARAAVLLPEPPAKSFIHRISATPFSSAATSSLGGTGVASSSAIVSRSDLSDDPFNSSPVCPAKAYAQNISATYAAKLVNGDFTVDLQDRAIAEAYRVAAKSMLTAYWFAKDDPTMLAVLGAAKCHTYVVLDLKDYDPNSEHQLWTTTKAVLNKSPTIMHKATPSAPTAGPSQLQPSDQVITLSSDDDDDDDTSIVGTPTHQKLRSSSSVSPTKSTKNKWPLKYACNMDKGFHKMAAKPGTRPSVFGEVFKGCQWASSTYYDHHKAWENLSEKQIAAAVAYGRTPEVALLSSTLHHHFLKQTSCAVASAQDYAVYDHPVPCTRKKVSYSHLHLLSVMAPTFLSAEYLHAQVVESGDHFGLSDLVARFSSVVLPTNLTRLAKNPLGNAEAIKQIVEAKVQVDWAYILSDSPDAENRVLDNFIRGHVAAKRWPFHSRAPTEEQEQEGEGESHRPKKSIKPRETIKYSWEDWYADNVWRFIIHDPAVDAELYRTKVLVVDYTDQENDLVDMHRFNLLPLEIHALQPQALASDQVASPEATTYAAKTAVLLHYLYRLWHPVNSTSPFQVAYTLPGYGNDEVTLFQYPKGFITGTKEDFKGQWMPPIKIADHYVPIVGPPNAHRILLVFTPYDPKPSAPVPEVSPAAVPAPAPAPAPVALTPAEEKNRAAAAYLLEKYGPHTVIQKIRSGLDAEAAEEDADTSQKKGPKKAGQPPAMMVEWVAVVDEIVQKHGSQKIPASVSHKGKFTQGNFEVLFNRRIGWINLSVTAADLVRKKKHTLKGQLLESFETFLGVTDNGLKNRYGVDTFHQKLQEFVNSDVDEQTFQQEKDAQKLAGKDDGENESD
ncbi:hypothetical protein B0H17DRAFT_1133794 [Mycena rosella]|uniref:Uncharacterized protein n=1 Tax=Mycena rosella TaxID=1033263 RepID=A0AAD7DH97_MYCRO|nr:hypothetical protein B0H17DRAFT_1133794 [Mycena rosella]